MFGFDAWANLPKRSDGLVWLECFGLSQHVWVWPSTPSLTAHSAIQHMIGCCRSIKHLPNAAYGRGWYVHLRSNGRPMEALGLCDRPLNVKQMSTRSSFEHLINTYWGNRHWVTQLIDTRQLIDTLPQQQKLPQTNLPCGLKLLDGGCRHQAALSKCLPWPA